MKLEDKQLLLVDLCGRLPYAVKCNVYKRIGILVGLNDYGTEIDYGNGEDTTCEIKFCKPYLRPMSSMTEEEQKILEDFGVTISPFSGQMHIPFDEIEFPFITMQKIINYLYSIHIDINGLIPKGLALSTEKFNPYL